jgi:glutaredoxin
MGQLILFGTQGCHLCEEAEQLLAAYKDLAFETIDIAEHPEWQDRYAVRIPVLLNTDIGAELAWPFDAREVEAFVKNIEVLENGAM